MFSSFTEDAASNEISSLDYIYDNDVNDSYVYIKWFQLDLVFFSLKFVISIILGWSIIEIC